MEGTGRGSQRQWYWGVLVVAERGRGSIGCDRGTGEYWHQWEKATIERERRGRALCMEGTRDCLVLSRYVRGIG